MSETKAMNRSFLVACALVAAGAPASTPALAQPSPLTSFFVTSVGNGLAGGNFGGLAGADAYCQSLANIANVGAGRTWSAYLSTVQVEGVSGTTVHARDRIGAGPWFNYAGEQVAASVAGLHASGIPPSQMMDELGSSIPSNEHDILTGSNPDGTAKTDFPDNPTAPPPNCRNWTTSSSDAYGWVGHEDQIAEQSWSSVHPSPCDQTGLNSNGGNGRLYCFATFTSMNAIFGNGFESGDVTGWSEATP